MAVVNLTPGLLFGPALDAAVFLLIGSAVRNGAIPYRDYWDHKPPGAYLVNAVGQAILPWLDRWLIDWLMTVVATVAAIVMLERLLRPRVGVAVAWASTLVFACVVTVYPVALGGGYTESFALPLLVCGLWLLARGDRRGRSLAATGVVLAAACLFSLQSVPAAVSVGLAMIVSTPRETLRRGLLLATPGAVLPVAVVTWLAWGGALGAAWDQLVHYDAVYRTLGGSWIPANTIPECIACVCLLPPVLVTCVRIVAGAMKLDRVTAACFGWVGGFAALVVFEQRLYPHYLILLVPALAVIAAPSLAWFAANVRAREACIRRTSVALLALTVALMLLLQAWSVEWMAITQANDKAWQAEVHAAATWIDSNTSPSASVYVWGNHPELYLRFDRPPMPPYLYEFPLTTQGYWSPGATDRVVESWSQDGPDVIVEAPGTVPLSLPAGPALDDPRTYDVLDKFRAFVKGHYRLALDQADLRIWQHTGPNGPP
jgi:hypothetical protein